MTWQEQVKDAVEVAACDQLDLHPVNWSAAWAQVDKLADLGAKYEVLRLSSGPEADRFRHVLKLLDFLRSDLNATVGTPTARRLSTARHHARSILRILEQHSAEGVEMSLDAAG